VWQSPFLFGKEIYPVSSNTPFLTGYSNFFDEETMTHMRHLFLIVIGLLFTQTTSAQDTPKFQPYGFVRLDVIIDDSRLSHPQFPNYVQSEPSGSNGSLNIHPRLTRFGVKIAKQTISNTVSASGQIEIDFQNGGRESRETPRMRHGFATLHFENADILLGQTWDLISPLYPAPNSDGLMWNAGNMGDRRPQLRATIKPNGGNLTLAGALGMPNAVDGKDLDGGSGLADLDGADAAIPMIQGLVEINTTRLRLGAWGHWGREKTATPVGGKTAFDTYSLGGHFRIPFGKAWAQGEAFMGQNLSDVRGGIGQSVNTTTGKEIESKGGWAELGVKATQTITLTVGGTIDDPTDAHLSVGGRTLNYSLYGVYQYRPVSAFQIAAEYLYWKTEYSGLAAGKANRVDLHATLYF